MPARNRQATKLVTEAEFQHKVIETAMWLGWRVFHPRTVHTNDGRHLTAYTGNAGFPDLVLAHKNRGVIFAELKTATGKLTEHQKMWQLDLDAGGAEHYVWRPDDWPDIEARLKEKRN